MKLKTEKYFRILIIIIMGIVFLPIISSRLPKYMDTLLFWSIIWGVSLLVFKPKIIFNKIMLIVILYGFFIWIMLYFVWINMDDWNVSFLKQEFWLFFLSISIITYFNTTKDYEGLAIITKFSLIFIGITAIMTVITTIINPMYARFLFSEKIEGELARKIYYVYGAGNYSTVIAFMSLLPVWIYYYKNNLQFFITNKSAILILILIIFIAVFRMQFFTNIFISLIIASLSFISPKKSYRNVLIISVFAFTLIRIPSDVYINTLRDLSIITEDMEDVSFKLKEFAVYIERGGNIESNEVAIRAERFPMLKSAFLKSPIIGCYYPPGSYGLGYRNYGAHLYWMNKLTVTGIIGILFFVSIFFLFIKNEINLIQGEFRYYYILSFLSIIIYGFLKNLGGKECWFVFFIILPGMYYLPLLKNKQENNAESTEI